MKNFALISALIVALPLSVFAAWGKDIHGVIADAAGHPLEHASVIYNGIEHFTDAAGEFEFVSRSTAEVASAQDTPLIVKKPGFRKILVAPQIGDVRARLETQEIKSIYMQAGLAKHRTKLYLQDLALLGTTELNAMTVDWKDDNGLLSSGMKPTTDELHAHGFYAIARMVTFKDNTAPRKHPELALLNKKTKKPWEDRNHVTYLNPYNPKSWEYVIGVAKDAVADGFDEIQFDYVRFPTDGDRSMIAWDGPMTADGRTDAIAGFLKAAREQLGPLGVYIAADVFGITAYDTNDSGIGQRVEDITPFLDYVCPMVYPSGFAKNTSGLGIPVDHPGEIVADSVHRYRVRADKFVVVRPWLQAFRDYAFNHRAFGDAEIRAQITNSAKQGGFGFLLWNAGSSYTAAGLNPKTLPVHGKH